MTRRVRYLIDTPNATLGGDSYRPGRKGDMGAEAWVREEELDRLREAILICEGQLQDAGEFTEKAWVDVMAALPPPPGGDDEGEG